MQKLILSIVALAALSLAAVAPRVLHSEPAPIVIAPPAASVAPTPAVVAPSLPVEDDVAQGTDDPWYPTLRQLVETLSDAYFDKPDWNGVRMTEGEKPLGRSMRLDAFTRDVLAAVRDRAGELAQFGPDAAWGYASTLIWTAHRETRIASDPSKLGNQDQGKAHGYLQVWEWHGMNPYAMSTALDMMMSEPESSWSLPKGHPWLGYPECAKWLKAHPAP